MKARNFLQQTRAMKFLSSNTDRRQFIKQFAVASSTLAIARVFASESTKELPTRILGRTKAKVSILGLGTAPIGEAFVEPKEAEKIFGEVMDRGVNYIDTARIYGHAEEILGKLVPQRRDKLFLVTKVWTESGADAERIFNESLKKLKVDYVDLVHIHHIGGKNIDKVLADDGVLPFLLKQKDAGKLRFIGVSGHAGPSRFLKILETGKIDVLMSVMNYADRNIYNFEGRVIPECIKQNVGVVAMKVYAGIKGGFPFHKKGWVGCATPPERLQRAMYYALDLKGVSVANVGPFTLEQAIQNVEFARNYQPLTEEERTELLDFGKELAQKLGPRYGPTT